MPRYLSQQLIDLALLQGLRGDKSVTEPVEVGTMTTYDDAGSVVGFVDQAAHLVVDSTCSRGAGGVIADVAGIGSAAGAAEPNGSAHAEVPDHLLSQDVGPDEVVLGAVVGSTEHDLLGYPAGEENSELRRELAG